MFTNLAIELGHNYVGVNHIHPHTSMKKLGRFSRCQDKLRSCQHILELGAVRVSVPAGSVERPVGPPKDR